jgi:predicted dehydrogenase
MDKARVGVVGTGAFGKHHARVYASLPDTVLSGVADTHPGRAREVAEAFGTRAYPAYTDLFGKVDAVSIATPTTLHAEIGEHFLKEGIHVLVEKPIAPSLEDADRLMRAAESNRRVLQVGHLERFNPAVRLLQDIVKRPRFFESHRMGSFSARSLDVDVILDLMIHDLDIICSLAASPVDQVQAVGIAILTDRIDIANARIRFQDGCVANVTASRVSVEKVRKLRLFQKHQYISLDYTRQDVAVFSLEPGASGGIPEIVNRRLTPEKREPLHEELTAFLSSVRGLEPVRCSGQEGRRALDLALQVREQAEKAQALEIDRP